MTLFFGFVLGVAACFLLDRWLGPPTEAQIDVAVSRTSAALATQRKVGDDFISRSMVRTVIVELIRQYRPKRSTLFDC